MKIQLSKSQWEHIGKQAGWIVEGAESLFQMHRRPNYRRPLSYYPKSTVVPSEETKEEVRRFEREKEKSTNWDVIKSDFLNGLSEKDLVYKYHIPLELLERKMEEEGWKAMRPAFLKRKRKKYEDFDEVTRNDIRQRLLDGENIARIAEKFRTTVAVVEQISKN